jgi:membrane protease YdiL (CAAX protease family)
MEKPKLHTTLLVMGGTLVISLMAHERELSSWCFLLTLLMIAEGVLRHRRWRDMGFKLDTLWSELEHNVFLIFLVGVIMQVGFWLVTRFLYPPLWVLVQERLNLMRVWFPSIPVLFAFIFLETLSEEVGCRGFVQGRLSPYMGMLPALLLANVFFAAGHWQSHVNLPATMLDIMFVALDGVIYGWLYARSGNVFVSWLAHLLADVVGLVLLLQ